MKEVLLLIIFVIWGVLQARRKAMREQRKQQQQGITEPNASRQLTAQQLRAQQLRAQQLRARQASPLGPVTAEENESQPIEREDRSHIATTIPEEIRAIVKETRRAKRQKQEAAQAESQEEPVKEIVSPAPSEEAYDTFASNRRRISFDTEALRTFVVTREILGPPRVRNPHRPGVRWR